MKQIVKNPEPQQFSAWKATRQRNWERVRLDIKAVIHDALMNEQGSICCYCESRVKSDDSHVEHFRPKSKYPRLQLDYSNLHCSCLRNLSQGEPRHCGHRKSDWFDATLLISPLQQNCDKRFMFAANGEIRPRCSNDSAAATTIKRLGLCLPKLNRLRAAAVNALSDLQPAQIEKLLVRGPDGSFLPYYTTIEDVLLPPARSSARSAPDGEVASP